MINGTTMMLGLDVVILAKVVDKENPNAIIQLVVYSKEAMEATVLSPQAISVDEDALATLPSIVVD